MRIDSARRIESGWAPGFALIFAALAAAAAVLAYVGDSYSRTGTLRQRERDLMRELAQEKIVGIESRLVAADNKLFESGMSLDALIGRLEELASGLPVVSVFVLDEELKLIPGGYVGDVSQRHDQKEAIEYRVG